MFLPYPVLKYTFVMHVIVVFSFFINSLKASQIFRNNSLIYDEVTIPRKSLIDQPRYQTHTREQVLIFQVLSANTGSSRLNQF